MTPQRLGPIELDANGEASGEGWRVERGADMYWLILGTEQVYPLRWAGHTLSHLARNITTMSEYSETTADWCRAVGWPGFEAEIKSRILTDLSQPFWLPPDGATGETYTATLENRETKARWVQRIWMDYHGVWRDRPDDGELSSPITDRVVSLLIANEPDRETP